MDAEAIIELLKALRESMDSHDQVSRGHPSSRSAQVRARLLAEKEAVRRLINTGSRDSALAVGIDAYAREMRYFSPLTLVRDEEPAPSEEVRREGQG